VNGVGIEIPLLKTAFARRRKGYTRRQSRRAFGFGPRRWLVGGRGLAADPPNATALSAVRPGVGALLKALDLPDLLSDRTATAWWTAHRDPIDVARADSRFIASQPAREG